MRIVTFVFCAIAGACSAQDFGASLAFGANFSQVDGDQLGGYNKLGINAGLQINRKINNDWEGAFEVRFSMKGAKKVLDPDLPTPDLKLSYHYLEVPLLAKYTKYDKITPYAGLAFGVNVFNERNENSLRTEESELRLLETSFLLGATYHITPKVGIDLRHSMSITSIRDQKIIVQSARSIGNAGWRNRLFTLGLVFNLSS